MHTRRGRKDILIVLLSPNKVPLGAVCKTRNLSGGVTVRNDDSRQDSAGPRTSQFACNTSRRVVVKAVPWDRRRRSQGVTAHSET
jgi:hypothetical protein